MSTIVNILLSASGGAAVVSALDRVRGSMGSLATTALGTTSAVAGIESALDLGGQLNDLSNRTRESVRDLVVMGRAMDTTGVRAANLAVAQQQLARAISGVNEMGESTAEVFKRLDLRPEALRVQSFREQVAAFSTALGGIENPAERAAIAARLFGRSGGEMLQLFGDSTALTQAEKDAGRLADRLQRDSAKFDEIGDRLSIAKVRLQEFWVVATEKAVPTLEKIASVLERINPAPFAAAAGNAAVIFGAAAAAKTVVSLDNAVLDWATRQGSPIGQAFAGRFLAPLTGALARVLPVGLAAVVTTEVLKGIVNAMTEWRNGQLDKAMSGFSRVSAVQKSATSIATEGDRVAAIAAAQSLIKDLSADLAIEEDRWWKNDGAIASYRQQIAELKGTIAALRSEWAEAAMARNRFHIPTAAEQAAMEQDAQSFLRGSDAKAIRDRIADYYAAHNPQSTLDNLKTSLALTERNITISKRIAESDQADAIIKKQVLELEGNRVRILEQIADLEKTVATRANEKAQAALNAKELGIQKERANLEANIWKTEAEKYSERKRLIQEEIAAQERSFRVLQDQHDATTDENVRAQIGGQARSVLQSLGGLRAQETQLGPDPNSWAQQSINALTQLQNSWGTVSQQIGNSIQTNVGGAVDSVTSGLTDWVTRAKDGDDALKAVEQTIGVSIIQSILRMGVTWVANLAIMAAKWVATRLGLLAAEKSIQVAATAALIPIAAAQSAVWATPATLSTIASAGATAAAAPGEITAATGVTKALALIPGYLEGGIAEGRQLAWLSEDGKPEGIFSAPAVENIGGPAAFNRWHAAALRGDVTAFEPAFSPTGNAGGGTGTDLQAALRDFAGRITLINVREEVEATRIARRSRAAGDVVAIVKDNIADIMRAGP